MDHANITHNLHKYSLLHQLYGMCWGHPLLITLPVRFCRCGQASLAKGAASSQHDEAEDMPRIYVYNAFSMRYGLEIRLILTTDQSCIRRRFERQRQPG